MLQMSSSVIRAESAVSLLLSAIGEMVRTGCAEAAAKRFRWKMHHGGL